MVYNGFLLFSIGLIGFVVFTNVYVFIVLYPSILELDCEICEDSIFTAKVLMFFVPISSTLLTLVLFKSIQNELTKSRDGKA